MRVETSAVNPGAVKSPLMLDETNCATCTCVCGSPDGLKGER